MVRLLVSLSQGISSSAHLPSSAHHPSSIKKEKLDTTIFLYKII